MFKYLTIASILGFTAVILGAFGAHALKEVLTSEELQSFQTGVRYQMFHAILLLFISTYKELSTKQLNYLNLFFITGIVLFSGSIYAIYLTSIDVKSIWFVTPLGGAFLIAGWFLLIAIFLKKSIKK